MTQQRLDDLLDQWSHDLGEWAVPQEILDQAEEPPWLHKVSMFTVDLPVPDSPSHRAARAALPKGGSVLDVGCGGGRASAALVPPAGVLVGVDNDEGMLEAYRALAGELGVDHSEVLGTWPDAAPQTLVCDVVVCHHVAFNVPHIGPFLQTLDEHARRRVVIELPTTHPQSNLNPLWKRMWGIDRPTTPTASDLCAIAVALGFDARIEVWTNSDWGMPQGLTQADQLDTIRRRLCLPKDREDELASALAEMDSVLTSPRELATIWWDARR